MSCRSHHIFFYYYWAVLLCTQIIEYIMARWSYSFVCTLCFLLLIIIMVTYLKVVNFYNTCQVHFVETRLKIWSIFSIIFIVIYWSVFIQLTHFSFDQCENRCTLSYCPACRTSLISTRFWVVVICPIIKCLTVLEFSFVLFDLCLFITIFNFILNYVPIVTFWIFTYHKIWILLIIFCFIWSYWIIYFLTCLEVFWSVVS